MAEPGVLVLLDNAGQFAESTSERVGSRTAFENSWRPHVAIRMVSYCEEQQNFVDGSYIQSVGWM